MQQKDDRRSVEVHILAHAEPYKWDMRSRVEKRIPANLDIDWCEFNPPSPNHTPLLNLPDPGSWMMRLIYICKTGNTYSYKYIR